MRAAVLCAAVLAVASIARAGESLEKARQAYDNMDYAEVVPLLNQALLECSSPAEEIEVYLLMATFHVTFDREVEAQTAFLEVLRRQPDFQLPEQSSPKLIAALAKAREMLGPQTTAVDPALAPPSKVTATTGTAEPTGEDAPLVADADPGESADEATDSATLLPGDTWIWAAAVGGATVLLATVGVVAWTLTQPRVEDADFGPYRMR